MLNEATLAIQEDSDRKGDWMVTFSGHRYYPLDPRPEDIFIEDVAHALSLLCRYTGHIKDFYSVAEHCYHVSKAVPEDYALEGLLHDAEECYTNDICRPLKMQPEMVKFREIGELNRKIIFEKFGLVASESDVVKRCDARMIANESKVLFREPQTWCILEPVPNIEIQCWEPKVAEQKYLERFYELTK